jgi:hypothetical protein
VIRLRTEVRGHVITFAPYTTRIFQILDLTLFDILKMCPGYELPFGNDHAIVKFTMKVYHNFRHTRMRPNGWGAFHAVGLDFNTRRER